MVNEVIQSELDRFEEYILAKIFGNINNLQCSKVIQLYLMSKNIKLEQFINNKIQMFEAFISDYMTSDGIVEGDRLTKYVIEKYPALNGCITLPSIKLSEYAKIIDNIIGLDAVGHIIRNLWGKKW